jgi:hypothetical protein
MALPYSEIGAIAHNLILEKATHGVFNSNTVLKRFRDKAVIEEGGNNIKAPLAIVDDTGTNGGFYSPNDSLSLSSYDALSASFHEWKYINESIVILKADIAKAGGKYGVLKLIDEKVRVGERAMQQRMMKGLYSDGTVSTGALSADQYVGVLLAIKGSGTYGSIAPADLASWISYVNGNSGTPRAISQAILDLSIEKGSKGSMRPTLGFGSTTVVAKIKALMPTYQRVVNTNSSLNGLGHKDEVLDYAGVAIVADDNIDSSDNDSFYLINENFAKIHVHKDNNMRVQKISDLETSDSLLERIFDYSAFVVYERCLHSKIEDITLT